MPLEENIRWHVQRFGKIAKVLEGQGCSLGLEFLGPKTIWNGHKYEFIRDMNGMLDLAAQIGPNVGLLLDCWHWYTAGNTTDDILRTTPDRIVYVHVNDAPEGISADEQIDSKRRMPGETGVIDIAGFLQALKSIGYVGPVTPEPFSEKVKGIAPEEAARMTGESMLKIWGQAGL
jgi:sugar phosphate isomerase/epimerase